MFCYTTASSSSPPPPPIHATPQFMQSPSASNPLFKQPHLLMQPPRPLFVPCHRPPHHALQGTQVALPYDDMGATTTDALDGAITHRIVQ